MAQKIRRINSRCTKRRVAGKGGEDEQPSAKIRILRNFAGYEISHPGNFRRLRKFVGHKILEILSYILIFLGAPAKKQDKKL